MTFTKEWLQKAISDIETMRDEIPFGLDEDERNTLAALKLALASLEAKPVAQVLSSRAGNDTSTIDKALPEGTMLFTAPPAPVVPDEMTMQKALSAIERLSWQECTRDAYMLGWNACRAAMLQGAEPVTTANKLREGVAAIRNSGIAIDAEKIKADRDALNSPVIPDGWVACSERMPETEGHYLVWATASKLDGYCGHMAMASYRGGEWSNEFNWLVTHWMPLPAAPQQED